MSNKRRIGGVLVTLAALLSGCAQAPPPPPPPPQPLDVEVRVVVAPDVNPNRSGRASPVFLRVFALRDQAKFQNAEFDDVTLRADATLAATLIGREERMVEPGSTKEYVPSPWRKSRACRWEIAVSSGAPERSISG